MEFKGFIKIADGLYYEIETGRPWTNRVEGSSKRYLNYLKPLTCKNKQNINGYYRIWNNKRNIYWHRVVFEYFNGSIPEGYEVDHKNNVRDDNRIDNLQLLTNKDNSRFLKKHKDNQSGYAGVSYNKHAKKYVARIRINYKLIHLGYFSNPQEANDAYIKAKIEYHGQESIRSL
jgi:hypothetical protein